MESCRETCGKAYFGVASLATTQNALWPRLTWLFRTIGAAVVQPRSQALSSHGPRREMKEPGNEVGSSHHRVAVLPLFIKMWVIGKIISSCNGLAAIRTASAGSWGGLEKIGVGWEERHSIRPSFSVRRRSIRTAKRSPCWQAKGKHAFADHFWDIQIPVTIPVRPVEIMPVDARRGRIYLQSSFSPVVHGFCHEIDPSVDRVGLKRVANLSTRG